VRATSLDDLKLLIYGFDFPSSIRNQQSAILPRCYTPLCDTNRCYSRNPARARRCGFAAPPSNSNLPTESGVQITRSQQWLQCSNCARHRRCADSRSAGSGTSRGSKIAAPTRSHAYHVVGILSAGEELRLPGGTFHAATALIERYSRRSRLTALKARRPHAAFRPHRKAIRRG